MALAEEEDGVAEKPEDGDMSLGAEAEENRVEETDCREDVGAAEEGTAEEAEAEGLPVGVAELAVAVAEEAESDGVPGAMTNDEDTADDVEGDAVLDTADEDPRDALGVELDVTDADEETEGGTDALDATVETGEGDAEPKTEEASALETADGGAIEMTLGTSNELVTIAELDGTELDTEFKTDETDAVDSADADAVDFPLGGTLGPGVAEGCASVEGAADEYDVADARVTLSVPGASGLGRTSEWLPAPATDGLGNANEEKRNEKGLRSVGIALSGESGVACEGVTLMVE